VKSFLSFIKSNTNTIEKQNTIDVPQWSVNQSDEICRRDVNNLYYRAKTHCTFAVYVVTHRVNVAISMPSNCI